MLANFDQSVIPEAFTLFSTTVKLLMNCPWRRIGFVSKISNSSSPNSGKPLAFEYQNEDLGLLEKGCANMQHHIRNAKKFGVEVVVAVNQFHTDTLAEIDLVIKKAMEAGAFAGVRSNHWAKGGAGAVDVGNAVVEACAKARSGALTIPPPLATNLLTSCSHLASGSGWAQL